MLGMPMAVGRSETVKRWCRAAGRGGPTMMRTRLAMPRAMPSSPMPDLSRPRIVPAKTALCTYGPVRSSRARPKERLSEERSCERLFLFFNNSTRDQNRYSAVWPNRSPWLSPLKRTRALPPAG